MLVIRSVLIRLVVAGAMAAVVPAMASAQAGAQATSLSEKISQLLKEAQMAETLRLYERAIDLYQKALKDGTVDSDKRRQVLKARGLAYERVDEAVKAEADLTAALQTEPVDPKLYAERGYFYLRQGRYPDALADFVAGTRVDAKNPLFSFGAGRVMVALKNDPGAIALYDDAIRLNPRDGMPYIARAEAYIRLKMFAEAIADYDRAAKLRLKSRNDWFFLHLGRGYAQLTLEQYDDAVRDLNEALDLLPNDLQALMWRGFARERLGDRDRALGDYELAYRVSPKNEWVRASLSRLRSYEVAAHTPAAN